MKLIFPGRNIQIRYFFACLFFVLAIGSPSISARPGDLDNSFGAGGKVVTPIKRATHDYAYASVIQPDGKIVVAGRTLNGLNWLFTVSRFNPDGSFDLSFGQNGRAAVEPSFYNNSNNVTAVALTPEGKIIVGGYSLEETQFKYAFTLVRFNADGTLDETFGSGGIKQTVVENFYSYLTSLAVQPDGKIVAAGYLAGGTSPALPNHSAVARFNPNGSLDTTFSGEGMLALPASNNNRFTSVTVQPDNKILLGGFATVAGNTDFYLVRLNADGSFDNLFDGDGSVTTPIGSSHDGVNSIAVLPGGKILAAGVSSNGTINDIALARYNSDGSLDSSFDLDGKAVTGVSTDNEAARSLALQTDGKIVITGFVTPGNFIGDFLAMRFNSNGSLDTTFDGDGIARTPLSPQNDEAHAALIQADGKIVSVGTSANQTFDIAMVRYNPDGSLDAGFGTNGVAHRDLALNTDLAFSVALQADGKIVAAGYSHSGNFSDMTVARYNPDGSLDTGFGDNGAAVASFNAKSQARDLIIQPDGKIVVGGVLSNGATEDFALVRFNSNGSLDLSFGNSGLVTTAFVPNGNDFITSLALQADGKIVAGGVYTVPGGSRDFGLARYHPNGALDTSFDGDGKATAEFNEIALLGAIEIKPNGKIVASGSLYLENGVSFAAAAQFNSNGSLDTTFDGDGKTTVPLNNVSTFSFEARGLAVQPDGKLVIGGSAYDFNSNFAIVRLNADGSLDATFDGDGIVYGGYVTNGGQLWSLILQPDGKIVIGGSHTSFSGSDFALARLNPNGSFDNSFGTNGRVVTPIGTGEDEAVGIVLQPDGKIVAAGYSNGRVDVDFTLARYEGGTTGARTAFDFDGDGRADISVFRTNTWYIQRSQDGFAGAQWGASGDLIALADYDGDGKTDLAVFRPSTGYWYILNSSDNKFTAAYFGKEGDLPRPGDYDGDGRADISVFRPSDGTWYRQNSSNNQFAAVKFGQNGDVPLSADFDGDGKSDVAVFRQGFWYYLQSSDNQFKAVQFGTGSDKPVIGDFDGDGKSDVSVFRPSAGAWYRLNSSNSEFVGLNFGVASDIPTPADYDGDGKTDVSVFRPSTGHWYRMNSANNAFYAEQFGINGDQPAPAALNQ